MNDGPEFNHLLDQRYVEFEDRLDAENPDEARQLWHTPTELFRPHYGEAIARYLVTNYKLTLYPYHDLIIYEMGAGNGTMMLNILDYIRDTDPEVYQRTKYKIIEISSSLADLQEKNLRESINAGGHLGHAEVINRSIFDWDTYVHSPCFFLALEVFDNFAHDAIRYNLETERPQQGSVLIDADGEFYEYYAPHLDPVAARFLRVRAAAARRPYPNPLGPRMLRGLRSTLPFAPNFSEPEYIPTRLMQFFDTLHAYFPAHRLVASDFSSLPDAVPGLNAPVVQTRYRRRNVPVSTPFVSFPLPSHEWVPHHKTPFDLLTNPCRSTKVSSIFSSRPISTSWKTSIELSPGNSHASPAMRTSSNDGHTLKTRRQGMGRTRY